MRTRGLRLGLAAASAAAVSVAASAGAASSTYFPLLPSGVTYPVALPAVPIPAEPAGLGAASFIGSPAIPRPMAFVSPPRHPFMAPNERSNLHDDAYQTDAYTGTGPLGHHLQVLTSTAAGICGSVTFDSRGRIVSVCVGPVGTTLQVIDPLTLGLLASYPLPTKVRTGGSKASFGGGGYFYLDQKNEAVVPTSDGRIVTLAISQDAPPRVTLRSVVDLSKQLGAATIESALPDWRGRIWFVSTDGLVGVVDSKGTIRTHQLLVPGTSTHEAVGNSFAIDETGGVFVVSEWAQYRLDVNAAGAPVVTWRIPYDRGQRLKPGMVNHGSGTTPTLLGSGDGANGGYLTILDNADPDMHLLVYPRGKRVRSKARPICSIPILTDHPNENSDENSIIAVGSSLFVENNYGNVKALGAPADGTTRLTPTTVPGLERVDVDLARGSCHKVWDSNAVRVPSSVSKVAAGSGLLFSVGHPSADELTGLAGSLPTALKPDAWYLTATDARTGKLRWSQLLGSSPLFNNYYAPVTIGPDNTAYIGVLGGIVAVRDS